MSIVNSVLGPISSDDLGITLPHEHLVTVLGAGWEYDAKSQFDHKAVVQKCVELLKDAKVYGVKTLVDATSIDCGRNLQVMKEVSERVGINVICSTGLFYEGVGASGYLKTRSELGFDIITELCETFVIEITQGIRDTGVKAGVIKVATREGIISQYDEMVLRAAARAQKETGVPIITHTDGGTMGSEQADIMISEGGDPKRIMIGHCGSSSDLRYFIRILEKGVYIAFDRMGGWKMPYAITKACIIGLISMGYANRILLSHDQIPCEQGREPKMLSRLPRPDWTYTFISATVIPDLKKAGISDDIINTMILENPRRLFGG